MSTDDLQAIIDRIANKQYTKEDITLLQRLVTDNPQIALQLGKYNVNIGEGKEIHIGDIIYESEGSQTPGQQRQSLEENILAKYYEKAGKFICESYVRNREPFIDDRCNDNLKRLQSSLQLLPGKTKDINEEVLKLCDINEEVLKLCESYGEPFKEQIQELKFILQNYGACSVQAQEWLEDCPKFIRDQQFVGTACSLVGYQLYVEGAIETASDFIKKLINSYPDSPLAYVTQGLIHYRQGKLKQSLEIVRSARYFYEKQENRNEEVRHFEEMEQVLQEFIQQKKFWTHFLHNITHTIAVVTRFLILG